MYSAKINGEPTTFGTSGMLYQSNKLMYDRTTNSLWNQFTGEPIAGPLASSGMRLPYFASVVTTWEDWLAEHPDTTVLSLETGIYDSAHLHERMGAGRHLPRVLRVSRYDVPRLQPRYGARCRSRRSSASTSGTPTRPTPPPPSPSSLSSMTWSAVGRSSWSDRASSERAGCTSATAKRSRRMAMACSITAERAGRSAKSS